MSASGAHHPSTDVAAPVAARSWDIRAQPSLASEPPSASWSVASSQDSAVHAILAPQVTPTPALQLHRSASLQSNISGPTGPPDEHVVSLGAGLSFSSVTSRRSAAAQHFQQSFANRAKRPQEPGLNDIAENLEADAREELPGFSSSPGHGQLPAEVYVHVMKAVCVTWAPDAPSIADRVELTEWLRDTFQIPSHQHHDAVNAALNANRSFATVLDLRARVLQALADSGAAPPAAQLSQLPVLQPSDFLDTEGGFAAWVARERSLMASAVMAQANQPMFTGLFKIKVVCVQGLKWKLMQRSMKRLLTCCVNPIADGWVHAPFLKVWLHAGAEGGDVTEDQAAVTRIAREPESLSGVEFNEDLPPLCVLHEGARLCMELKDLGPGGSAFNSHAIGDEGERMGAISIALSTFQNAGPGIHKCVATLVASMKRDKDQNSSPHRLESVVSAASSRPSLHQSSGGSRRALRKPSTSWGLRRGSNVDRSGYHSARAAPGSSDGPPSSRGLPSARTDVDEAVAARAGQPLDFSRLGVDRGGTEFQALVSAQRGQREVGTVTFLFEYLVDERRGAGDGVPEGDTAPLDGMSGTLDAGEPIHRNEGANGEADVGADSSGLLAQQDTPARLHGTSFQNLIIPSLPKPLLRALRSFHSGNQRSPELQVHTPAEAGGALWTFMSNMWAIWRDAPELARRKLVPPVVIPEACLPPGGTEDFELDPLLNVHSVLRDLAPPANTCDITDDDSPILPPATMLTIINMFAARLFVRGAEQSLLLLLLLIQDMQPTDRNYRLRISLVEKILAPTAHAAANGTLTKREGGLLMHANACILNSAAEAIENLHDVLLRRHPPETVASLLRIVGLATVYDPNPDKAAELAKVHFRAAILKTMRPHEALFEAVSPHEAAPAIAAALETLVKDLSEEAKLSRALPAGLDYLQTAASIRYKLVVNAVQVAWGDSPVNVDEDDDETEVSAMYDDSLQHMEDVFREVHALMVEVGVSKVKPGGRNVDAEPGLVSFMSCEGVALLNIDTLLVPTIEQWIQSVALKLERYAQQAAEAETAPPQQKRWTPLSRVRSQMYSQSVVDIFYVLVNAFGRMAERVLMPRPWELAKRSAEIMMTAAGNMLRQYSGFLEDECIADLAPAASAANAANALPPDARAAFSSHHAKLAEVADDSPDAATEVPEANGEVNGAANGVGVANGVGGALSKHTKRTLSSTVSALGALTRRGIPMSATTWPPLVTRQLAVKLNNLAETMRRLPEIEQLLAQRLVHARESHPGKRSRRHDHSAHGAPHGPNGAEMVSGEAPETPKSDLSFMSYGDGRSSADGSQFGMGERQHSVLPSSSAPNSSRAEAPSAINKAFTEVHRQVLGSHVNVLAGVRDVFAAAMTVEVARLLTIRTAPVNGTARSGGTPGSGTHGGTHSRTGSSNFSNMLNLGPQNRHDGAGGEAGNQMLMGVSEGAAAAAEASVAAMNEFAGKVGKSLLSRFKAWDVGGAEEEIQVKDLDDSQNLRQNNALDDMAPEELEDTEFSLMEINDMLEIMHREFQAMHEFLSVGTFRDVQSAMWDAVLDVFEDALLNSNDLIPPLTRPQARKLRHLRTILRDHFHADGNGMDLNDLDAPSIRVMHLFEFFLAPTASLELEYNRQWEVLRAGGEVQGGGGGEGRRVPRGASFFRGPPPGKSRGTSVTMMHMLQLLQQRSADKASADLLQTALTHAGKHAVQVLFDLPQSEQLIYAVSCKLTHHHVTGRIFLTTHHLAFSSAPETSPSSSYSLSMRPTRTAMAASYKLAEITTMSKCFVGRSRALAFTLNDRSQVTFSEFPPGGRDEFEESIRLHVMGSNTRLDRQLRGLTRMVAPAALKLPSGEQIERCYDCALHSLLMNRHGVLYVCTTMMLFMGQDASSRVAVKFADILKVELSQGYWLGGHSVVVSMSVPPHKFEICEITASTGEEMVAELLDCVARQSTQ